MALLVGVAALAFGVGSSVHTRRVLSWMGESDLTRIRMAAATRVPLFSFTDDERELALEAFERIDDVIMGGVSSSRLVLANDDAGGALFEGRLREQGGGFCGTRMKLLAEPLDLSAASGLYLEIDASGTEASSRVWKVAVRTRQDRGEVVYQRAFKPSAIGRERVFLPFDEFRLVRGPRLVPGVPPLSASQANETFQVCEDGSIASAAVEAAVRQVPFATAGAPATPPGKKLWKPPLLRPLTPEVRCSSLALCRSVSSSPSLKSPRRARRCRHSGRAPSACVSSR